MCEMREEKSGHITRCGRSAHPSSRGFAVYRVLLCPSQVMCMLQFACPKGRSGGLLFFAGGQVLFGRQLERRWQRQSWRQQRGCIIRMMYCTTSLSQSKVGQKSCSWICRVSAFSYAAALVRRRVSQVRRRSSRDNTNTDDRPEKLPNRSPLLQSLLSITWMLSGRGQSHTPTRRAAEARGTESARTRIFQTPHYASGRTLRPS